MVELFVSDFEDETELEKLLQKANIEYQLAIDLGNYGITTPYVIIDGVPLDSKRAKIWIKERDTNDSRTVAW